MTEPLQHMRRFAGIDIGTLTCRLLIADLIPGQPLKELRSDRRILRLGEGVDQTKQLSSAAMDRVIQCLREWGKVIDDHHVSACIAVATSAVRDAENRDEFLMRVVFETDLNVEVITGAEEARLTLLGIRSGLSASVSDVLALDIGGGSTEFILDRPGQKPITRSIDIGVVRLCERILHHDPPTDEEIHQAREWVSRETKAAMADIGDYRQATFIGTAGTITSLAAMAQKLPTYEPARIHNYTLRLETIQELEHTLLNRTKAERVGLPGLENNREEVIAAGAIIIRTIMETLSQEECLVSDLGLREGVVIDLATRKRNKRLRYLADEEIYKEDAYLALTSRFGSREGFEKFYSSLNSSAVKDEFLRAATFYLFFVKRGDWHVSVERSNPVINYLTNSFKFVAIFALIESLSDQQYKDFYGWLSSEADGSVFPINDGVALSKLNDRYKSKYGSIRRCKAFFENLPVLSQKALRNAIKVEGKPLDSVKRVAEFLYEERSKFVHEAELVLMACSGSNYSRKGSKVVESNLEMDVLLACVEEGLLAYFGKHQKSEEVESR